MQRKAFTLLELLIVIGILAVLATAMVLVINPAEYLKQARDAKRVGDIETLNKAFLLALQSGVNLGASTTISIALPDNASSTCGSLGLPKLPAGYQYRCVTDANLLKTDGTGWIPVDFTLISGGSPFGTIPADPSSDVAGGRYYYFIGDGMNGYIVAAGGMESEKFRPGGVNDKTSGDGGVNTFALEMGTNIGTYKQTNILINAAVDNLMTCTPGWDSALNGSLCPTNGFSNGYNSGVASPTTGYHAHANATCGLNGSGCLEYVDLNTTYGYPHRWLGVSQGFTTPGTLMGWTNGTKVKIRFMAKTDTAGKKVEFGLYHWSTSLGAYTFQGIGPAYQSTTLSKVGAWEEISQEFTLSSDWEMSAHPVTQYIYGNLGAEGKVWVDGMELTYK